MNLQFSQSFDEGNAFDIVQSVREYADELGIETDMLCMGLSEDMEEEQLVSVKAALEDAIDKANKEAVIQMGRCCMGFKWQRAGNGYRCEGGSHYVSDAEVMKHRRGTP